MNFSVKMRFMIILKVTKKQVFGLSKTHFWKNRSLFRIKQLHINFKVSCVVNTKMVFMD